MARAKSLSVLITVGLMTVSCAELKPDVLARKNASLYSVHQPIVQRSDYVLEVGTSSSGLPASEADRLRAWFDTLQLAYGDRVSVDTGGAYNDPVVLEEVARVAADYGLLLSEGAPITAGAMQPGALRIVVSRMNAFVPGCPDWSNAKLSGGAVTTETNYGCATNSNLAAMVADPNDLVLGQAGAIPSNSDTGSKAIKTYRDRAPTGAGGLKSDAAGGK